MEIIVGGIIEKNGKYLLVQEKKEDCYGKWNLPSGHLELEENLVNGAIREIREETGYNVEITGISLIGNDNFAIIIIFSSNSLNSKNIYNTKEILNIKWFSYDEILKMKDNLRFPILIKNAIKNKKNGISVPLNLIQSIK